MDNEETGARDQKNEVNPEAFRRPSLRFSRTISPRALPAADSGDVSSGEARTINQVATAKWPDQVYQETVKEFKAQEHVVAMSKRSRATGNAALPPATATVEPDIQKSKETDAKVQQLTETVQQLTETVAKTDAIRPQLIEMVDKEERLKKQERKRESKQEKEEKAEQKERDDDAFKLVLALKKIKPKERNWKPDDWQPMFEVGLRKGLKGRAKSLAKYNLRKRLKQKFTRAKKKRDLVAKKHKRASTHA